MTVVEVLAFIHQMFAAFCLLAAPLAAVPQVAGQAITGITSQSSGFNTNGASTVGTVEALSPDGRWVIFHSTATNLVGSPSALEDVYLWDRYTNAMQLISINAVGASGNGPSFARAVDPIGNLVLFESDASDLVPNDNNGATDAFLFTNTSNSIQRVSLDFAGNEIPGASAGFNVSDSGQFAVFSSAVNSIVPGDTNGFTDLFLRDLINGTVTLGTITWNGNFGNGNAVRGMISGDGQVFAFDSQATNMVPNDNNGFADVFTRTLPSGSPLLASTALGGGQTDGPSFFDDISSDGRWISFSSSATNIVLNDTNNVTDVFLYDRINQTTQRVSISSAGVAGNLPSFQSTVSDDGRYVSFVSPSTNLDALSIFPIASNYVHDTVTGATIRVSVTGLGAVGSGLSLNGQLSRDGTHLAIESTSSSFIKNDNNGVADVFLASTGALACYGIGCLLSNGSVPELSLSGPPTQLSWQTVSVQNGLPGASGFLYLGFVPANTPLGNGCTLYIDPVLPNPLPFTLNAAGSWSLSYQAAAVPAAWTMQAAVIDPAAGPGYALTNGVRMTIL